MSREKMQRIILASASPRRIELLQSLGLSFEIAVSTVEEETEVEGDPGEFVEHNALAKAGDAAAKFSDGLVIAADTIVWLHGRALGKPVDMNDARRMLRLLADNTHQVYSGIALIRIEDNTAVTAHAVTDVTFRPLSDEEIDRYLNLIKPLDKAGAYAIQGAGGIIIEKICGCYYNVVGLPLSLLDTMLGRFGVHLL